MNKKIIYGVFGLLIFAGIVGFNLYQKIFSSSVKEDVKIYISSKDDLSAVKKIISKHIKSIDDFSFTVKKKKFAKPKAGMYQLKKGMSNNALVNLLRSGNQTPIKVSFNNQDTVEKLAGRVAQQIEADSIDLVKAFTDEVFLKQNNLTNKSSLQIYIPNSYEFYWNTSAEKFRDKMLIEYNLFWNSNRLSKAKKLGLSKDQVITLASIVQKETSKKKEQPIVAGLYLNRLKKNWPLQADPTIIYCLKQVKGQDYIVKRVLTKDLEIKSPYNTYKNIGLPPTLIAMPDISSIDAVLNAPEHSYMYMCASVDKIGYHEFSKTLQQHNINARKYQSWINSRGINR